MNLSNCTKSEKSVNKLVGSRDPERKWSGAKNASAVKSYASKSESEGEIKDAIETAFVSPSCCNACLSKLSVIICPIRNWIQTAFVFRSSVPSNGLKPTQPHCGSYQKQTRKHGVNRLPKLIFPHASNLLGSLLVQQQKYHHICVPQKMAIHRGKESFDLS